MFFHFLIYKVKYGAAMLDFVDQQNANSMTIAVRSAIELYIAVKCEKELDQEILAFPVSHNHGLVRIHGQYAMIDDSKPTSYSHPIKKFDFTPEEGAERWTAYQFIRNVYDVCMPIHQRQIRLPIDHLPSKINFEAFQESGGCSSKVTG